MAFRCTHCDFVLMESEYRSGSCPECGKPVAPAGRDRYDDRITSDPESLNRENGEGRSESFRKTPTDMRSGDPESWRSRSDESSVPNIQRTDDKLRGVKGWLLFFCISLTILSPALILFTTIQEYRAIAELGHVPGLRMLVVVETCVNVLMVAFSLLAGIMLWTVSRGAVPTAKAYLVFNLLANLAAIGFPYLTELPPDVQHAALAEGVKLFLRSCVFFAVWFSYLSVSKRVKATYYQPMRDADEDEYSRRSWGGGV